MSVGSFAQVTPAFLDELNVNFAAVQSSGFNVVAYGAVGNGVTDNTAAIQAAINATQSAGGGEIFFPPGIYRCNGTLNVTNSNIALVGSGQRATQIKFFNGSSDSISVNGSGVAGGQLYGFVLRDMFITHFTKTGGIALNLQNAAAILVENCGFDQCWNGILVGTNTNGIEIRYTAVNAITVGGSYGIKWYSVPPTIAAQLTLIDVTVQCAFSGADGLVLDGYVATLRAQGLALLACRYGMRIINTANSASQMPQFGYIDDLEVDGASITAVQIECGFDWHFSNSDITNNSGASGQGSADLDALVILPDATHSVTRVANFVNCYIGNTQRRAANISAKHVTFTNCTLTDCSKAGLNSYPVMEFGTGGLGGNTSDCIVSGCIVGVIFGAGTNPSYGITIDASCQKILAIGCNFNGPNTGSVLDNSANTLNRVIGCIARNGTVLPDTINTINSLGVQLTYNAAATFYHEWQINSANVCFMTATAFYPGAAGGVDLGGAGNQFNNLFLKGNLTQTQGTINYLGVTTGAADTMVSTPTPALTAYTTGAVYAVKANAANATTAPTINISGLGAKTLVKRVSTALAANDYLANMFIQLQYDGTNMVLLNPVVN